MPYDERDETSGQFTPEFEDEDFLEALRELHGGTTSDVADAVGCKYRTAYARLNDLEDEDRVASREIGNSLLWEAQEPPETPADPSVGQSPMDNDRRGDDVTTGRETDETVDGILEGWPPAGQRKREQRRRAGRATLEWLRDDVDGATAGDFKDLVEPEQPVDGQSPDTWWRKSARPALERARDADLVTFTEGSKVWTWTADRDDVQGKAESDDTPASSGVYDPTEEF